MTWFMAAVLCSASISAQTTSSIRELDWTFKTRSGPVGVYKLSFAGPETSSLTARNGYVQFCAGPLGKFTIALDGAKDRAHIRAMGPVVFAIVVFASMAWSHRKKPASEGTVA